MNKGYIKSMGMLLALAIPAWAAGGIQFPVDLENLAARATESVNVTLDASMLHLASDFLGNNDPDQAKVKHIVSKLNGVYVRSFEFDKPGQYSMSDGAKIRAQLKKPEWTRIVGVQSSKGEHTEIYVKKNGNQVGGLVVLDAEPKELTIVDIDGAIDPKELSELGGQMGIPKVKIKSMGLAPQLSGSR
ncbi:MAG: DUF4252 domain-containing protein [Bryobacteraceae bacterium]